MKPEVGRRVFVGSVVAGVPLLIGSGSAVLGQNRGNSTVPRSRAGEDSAVATELRRQLKAAVRVVRQGKGEGARQVATVLRLWAAHGVAEGYDAHIRSGLARAIERHGRDHFLYAAMPHQETVAEAAEYGIPASLIAHPTLNPALRGKTLDTLLTQGITPTLRRTADWFDSVGELLDRQFVQPVQTERDSTSCAEMRVYKDALCDMADAVCFYAVLFPSPLTGDACAAAMGACLGAMLVYWGLCGGR